MNLKSVGTVEKKKKISCLQVLDKNNLKRIFCGLIFQILEVFNDFFIMLIFKMVDYLS